MWWRKVAIWSLLSPDTVGQPVYARIIILSSARLRALICARFFGARSGPTLFPKKSEPIMEGVGETYVVFIVRRIDALKVKIHSTEGAIDILLKEVNGACRRGEGQLTTA